MGDAIVYIQKDIQFRARVKPLRNEYGSFAGVE